MRCLSCSAFNSGHDLFASDITCSYGSDRHLRLYLQQTHVLELVLANWPSNMTRSKSRHLHIEGVVENIVMPRGLFQAELRARRIALHCASWYLRVAFHYVQVLERLANRPWRLLVFAGRQIPRYINTSSCDFPGYCYELIKITSILLRITTN